MCDGTVGGVEGAEDVEVGRDAEFLLGVGECDGEFIGLTEAFVVFDEGDEFSEDFGDVGAVDFVDDEEEFWGGVVGGFAGFFPSGLSKGADFAEDARMDVVMNPPISIARGFDTFDEFLISKRLVKSYKPRKVIGLCRKPRRCCFVDAIKQFLSVAICIVSAGLRQEPSRIIRLIKYEWFMAIFEIYSFGVVAGALP